MKMKKVIRKIIVLSAVLLLLTAATAFADNETVRLSSDHYQVKSGESFTVDVDSSVTFNGVDLRLTFDSDKLEIVEETSGVEDAMIADESNTVYMNASFVKAVKAKNGNLLSVTFKVKDGANGSAGIALAVKDLFYNDADYNPVDVTYQMENELARLGDVNIGTDAENSLSGYTASAEVQDGTVTVVGLSEGSSVTVTDKTTDASVTAKYQDSMKSSAVFADRDKTELLKIYELTANDVVSVGGKYTVSIPVTGGSNYDDYYIGQEIDGTIKWTKVRLQDGQLMYTTDRLGEVAIVGTKGSSVASEKYTGTLNGYSENGLPSWLVPVIVGALAVVVIVVVILIRKNKKSQTDGEEST